MPALVVVTVFWFWINPGPNFKTVDSPTSPTTSPADKTVLTLGERGCLAFGPTRSILDRAFSHLSVHVNSPAASRAPLLRCQWLSLRGIRIFSSSLTDFSLLLKLTFGGCSAALAKIISTPVNNVKLILQLSKAGYLPTVHYDSSWEVFLYIYRKRGEHLCCLN